MALPEDCWATHETEVRTLTQFFTAVRMISAYQAATGTRFVWRGVRDASWGLYSPLVRFYEEKHRNLPRERQLQEFERGVLDEAREWALDWHSSGGRLTALELLAALQHYGVPSRMLDFTFNPLIALWFAVEEDDNGDGRLFAIDASNRLIDRAHAMTADPWWWTEPSTSGSPWCTQPWIWRPPPLEPRIVRQEGCFLMGGVPSNVPPRNLRTNGHWRILRAQEVRTCMSVPFGLINYEQAVAAYHGRQLQGRPATARAFTIRITRKTRIRVQLERAFGYSHRSLVPGFPRPC